MGKFISLLDDLLNLWQLFQIGAKEGVLSGWGLGALVLGLLIVWKYIDVDFDRDASSNNDAGELELAQQTNSKSWSFWDYALVIIPGGGVVFCLIMIVITAHGEGKKKETAARQQQEQALQQEQARRQEQALQQEQAQKSAWVAEQTAKAQSAKDALNKRLLAIRLERATKDDPQAQFDLALQYLNGQGVVKDLSAAKEWLRKAASLGHNGARNKLAELQATVGSPL